MYYFSDNSINEITRIANNIMILFQQPTQIKLQNFVGEITLNKCCDPSKYQEILSLLQDENGVKKTQNGKKKEDKTVEKQLEYLAMSLMTRAFVVQGNNSFPILSIVQEVKK